MKGNNEIRMCQAEMQQAVEHYLNEVLFKEPVQVISIEEIKNSFPTSMEFVIKIAEKVKTP